LQFLIRLQEIDLDIDRYSEECEGIPEEISNKKQEIERVRQEFDEKNMAVKELQSKHKGLELDIAAIEETIKKQKTDLNVVKTNDQYKAIQSQIAKLEEEKSSIEEIILKTMEEIDSFKKNSKEAEANVRLEEGRINDAIKLIEAKIKEYEDKLAVLQEERKNLVVSVSPNALKKYDYIRKRGKDGLAIAMVENDNCGSCHIKLTAQLINEVSKNQGLVFCDNCSRILYIQKN